MSPIFDEERAFMLEQIKQQLEWIKQDDTLIVREIQDSATLCKLLRINAHLQFIYKTLEILIEGKK